MILCSTRSEVSRLWVNNIQEKIKVDEVSKSACLVTHYQQKKLVNPIQGQKYWEKLALWTARPSSKCLLAVITLSSRSLLEEKGICWGNEDAEAEEIPYVKPDAGIYYLNYVVQRLPFNLKDKFFPSVCRTSQPLHDQPLPYYPYLTHLLRNFALKQVHVLTY